MSFTRTAVACTAIALAPVMDGYSHWKMVTRAPTTAARLASRPVVARDAGPHPEGMPNVGAVTHVAMRNVDFFVDPDVVLHIHRLRGTMVSKSPGPILFDDKRAFVIRIATAEVGLTGSDLSALMNKYVFAYRGAPLKRLKVRTEGMGIVQTGLLHKGIDVPFEIHASLDVTPQGMIRIHPTKIKLLGINGGALMRVFGFSLEKLLDLSHAHGVSVHGNDMLLDPSGILPPPTIQGRVTSVRVVGNEVIQMFGGATDQTTLTPLIPPDPTALNFMYYKGGTLRFGRLLMIDAEMQIVDLDPSDPFKFNLDRYTEQLIAGYSRTLPDLGLEVYMRDIDKIGKSRQQAIIPH